ncbi:aliphatic nitrilase [Fusarium fujikuroi]|nr:aliphatic nitrilase [Fusarium fujikuroi]
MSVTTSLIKAAVVQAEPVWFDLPGTVTKTCDLIKDAASKGAKITAFPELWLPGYPTWIWARPMDLEMVVKYTKNSLKIDSSEMQDIKSCAVDNNMVVCLGFSERSGDSLYVAQCIINSNGKVAMTRRKLKPFHVERTIFGDGHGPSLDNVALTSVGRVGQLSCGEHFNPLINFNTFSQGEQIHCAAWPCVPAHSGGPEPFSMSDEAVAAISQVYSIQAQCYTLHSTMVISQPSIDMMGTKQAPVFNVPGGGNARIFAPDGRQLTSELQATEEGIVVADLDVNQVTMHKAILDTCGHNGRPELLWLGRDNRAKSAVRTERDIS